MFCCCNKQRSTVEYFISIVTKLPFTDFMQRIVARRGNLRAIHLSVASPRFRGNNRYPLFLHTWPLARVRGGGREVERPRVGVHTVYWANRRHLHTRPFSLRLIREARCRASRGAVCPPAFALTTIALRRSIRSSPGDLLSRHISEIG